MAMRTEPRYVDNTLMVDESKFLFINLIGGMRQGLAEWFARQPNTFVSVFDCEEELSRLTHLRKYGVNLVSVGTRESLYTLCKDADPRIRKAMRQVSPLLAREGCGASPMLGYLAGQKLVASNEFQHLTQMGIDRGMAFTRGRLPSYGLQSHGSYCGGSGAGLIVPITQGFIKALSTIPATIKCSFNLTGAITVTGVSPLAGLNSAGTLPSLVHYVIDNTSSERALVTVTVQLSELPPLGQDSEARNRLIGLDEQAFQSTQLQEGVVRITPNNATTGPLGNILAREMELFNELDVDRVVLPSVAGQHEPELRDALQQVIADPSLVRDMRWTPETRTLSRLSIPEIVKRASLYSFNDFYYAVTRKGEETSYRWEMDLGPEGEFELARVDEYFAEDPDTCSAAIRRLSLLRTFSVVADQEATIRRDDLIDCEEEIKQRMSQTYKLHRQCQKPGLLGNPSKLEERLGDEAELLRKAHDAKLDLEAQLDEIELGQSKVKKEDDILHGQIQKIQRLLEKFVPRGRDSFKGNYVLVTPLEKAFPRLLQLSDGTAAEQRTGLCALAPAVTLDGLAHIVGASIPKVEDIAQKICWGKPAIQCPPHGGLPQKDHVLKAYCLPPVDGAYSDLIRKEIIRLDPSKKSVVAFNDSTANGITVTRYMFRDFKTVEQLMSGLLWRDLQRAEDLPTGTLRFPTGRNQLPDVERILKEIASLTESEVALPAEPTGDDPVRDALPV